MTIRVMHINDTLSIGGAEKIIVEIANHSIQYGIEPYLCITRNGIELTPSLLDPIGYTVFGRTSRFDRNGFQKLKKAINEFQPDVLHIHSRSTLAFIACSRQFRLIPKLPVVYSDHNGMIELDDEIPLWFRYWCRQGITEYVGVTETMVLWAKKAGLSEDRITIIPNGLDLTDFQRPNPLDLHKQFNISKHRLIGIVVGRVNIQKGIDHLILCLSKCQTKEQFSVLIVGRTQDNPGYFRKCQELINELGISESVRFIGEHKNIPDILSSADFALLPSISESGPLVLIEYMAAGLPFGAFLVGNISKRANEKSVPGFVAPNRFQEFTDEIDRLVSLTKEQRTNRGLIGKRVADLEFDIATQMPRWLSIYEKAIAESKQ